METEIGLLNFKSFSEYFHTSVPSKLIFVFVESYAVKPFSSLSRGISVNGSSLPISEKKLVSLN